MPSITVIWVSMHDERVCPVCQALDGYQWVFDKDTPMTEQLTHPIYGLVWTMGVGSAAHGHKGNCRCSLSFLYDFADLIEQAKKLRDKLESVVAEMHEIEASGGSLAPIPISER